MHAAAQAASKESARAQGPAKHPLGAHSPIDSMPERPTLQRNTCPCGGGCPRCQMRLLQAKLAINQPGDVYEQEADRVAEAVMLQCAPARAQVLPFSHPGAEQSTSASAPAGIPAPPMVHDVLRSPGQPLDQSTRDFFEPRFGSDLSGVRVHTSALAAESASAVGARAFTVGNDIVFGRGEFAPGTTDGSRLLAHELTHYVQQDATPPTLRRQAIHVPGSSAPLAGTYTGYSPWPPAPAPPPILKLEADIRSSAAYLALAPPSHTRTEQIITDLSKRPLPERYRLLVKLEALFAMPTKPKETIAAETMAATATAATAEQARLTNQVEAKNAGIEEQGTRDPKRTWVAIPGRFGDGTYYVDRRSATDIHIRAKIYLHPGATVEAKDLEKAKREVDKIKGMEDAIEKAASTKGYTVDIEFVATKEADAFDVGVDPGKWEVATNWSGGRPKGFAHELHHMFAFELDKYNYIEAQATNADMEIDQRLIWFSKELSKPANFNDPTSIMDDAEHPNDSDVCTVAGLPMKDCLDARAKNP